MRRKSFHNKYDKEEVDRIYSIHVIPLIFIQSNLKHIYQSHKEIRLRHKEIRLKQRLMNAFYSL